MWLEYLLSYLDEFKGSAAMPPRAVNCTDLVRASLWVLFAPIGLKISVCVYIYILDAILLALLIRSVQWHGINYLNSYTWFRLRFLLPFFSPSHLKKGILVSPHPTPTFPFCLAPSAFSFHGSPHNRCNKGVVEMLFRVRDRTRVPLPSYPAA